MCNKKMKLQDWEKFKYFSHKEKWGNPEKMQWFHIEHLERIRTGLYELGCNWPFKIHSGYATSGHSPKSAHYLGLATDGHFVCDESLNFQVCALKEVFLYNGLLPFLDIGAYPEWNNPGFHFGSTGRGLNWVRKNGIYKYGELFKDA